MEISEAIKDFKNSDTGKHDIFRRNPASVMCYVYKEAEILTTDGLSHRGWVYTVDPVSQSFVLLQFNDEQCISGLEIVLGHSVKNISATNDDVGCHKSEMDALFKPTGSQGMSPVDSLERRDKLRVWLVRNRVPVELLRSDPNVLSVSGVLLILPPYSPDDCQSTNEIVLSRIQGLLGKFMEEEKTS